MLFFKSYFSEKGKNLATKEDINEITEIVEKVKNEVRFSTQSKFDLRTEERNALVNYYEKYNFWLHTITDTQFNNINEKNRHKLQEFEERMRLARLDYDLADGRMELFVRNKDLKNLIGNLRIKTLEFEHLVCEKMLELDYMLSKLMTTELRTPIEQSQKFSEFSDKKTQILKSFYSEKLDKYKLIVKLDREFQIIVYEHLKVIIQTDRE